MFAAASGRLGQDRQQRVVVEALRNISFSLRGGDRLGLIGSNGAGKTTLLRTLAGIYEPVTGHVRVEGSLNALLDPALGMNIDLTGRENIMLRGLYNGMPRTALAQLEDGRDGVRRPERLHRSAGAHLFVRHGRAAWLRARHGHPAADPADGRMDPGRRRAIPRPREACGSRRWCAAPKSSCCPRTT